MLALVREPSHASAAVVEDRSTRPAVITTVAARNHDGRSVLSREELSCFFAKLEPLNEIRESILRLAHMHRKFRSGLQVRIIATLEQWLCDGVLVTHWSE